MKKLIFVLFLMSILIGCTREDQYSGFCTSKNGSKFIFKKFHLYYYINGLTIENRRVSIDLEDMEEIYIFKDNDISGIIKEKPKTHIEENKKL
jgi:hypothetical protein